ncbi:hypothetical protein AK812_SmicGene29371 [Symbiodinium microadriaticum]|uniref:Uncharacterized protein n=1 Tax=Symbiodinium microadriaticum TaxID=2951 RepID=A0A1Q9D1Z8_SYMMI|nr:hypothetical protein AK812_SmicGene29371 [Symbiodinium microadriaticum]CAE7268534.1 unnamed protein product [Symbiodinium microadriaticum]
MPQKQLSKKPREDVELTDVDTDSDMDLQPVRLPHGLPLDEPPPCLPLSNLTEVEQVCQQHLSNGYIPMSVFPWLVQKLPSELLRASAPTRRGTPPMVFTSGAYYHAGSVGIRTNTRKYPWTSALLAHMESFGDLKTKDQTYLRKDSIKDAIIPFDYQDDRLVLSAYTPLRTNRLELSDIDHLVFFDTMDAAAPTTPPSSCSSYDYSDEGAADAAYHVLTNATLLKIILRFRTEIRVRVVAVQVENTAEARHTNQTIQGAMERITQRHPQTYHTTVIRDYRPQHALIEKLYGIMLTNSQVRYAARATAMDQRLTHGLFYQRSMSEAVRRLRPRSASTSPFCPLPVRDMLYHEDLQVWTCVQSSQQEVLALNVGEYQ